MKLLNLKTRQGWELHGSYLVNFIHMVEFYMAQSGIKMGHTIKDLNINPYGTYILYVSPATTEGSEYGWIYNIHDITGREDV